MVCLQHCKAEMTFIVKLMFENLYFLIFISMGYKIHKRLNSIQLTKFKSGLYQFLVTFILHNFLKF